MQQERLFSEFICSQYQSEIMTSIEEYAADNQDLFNLRVVEIITEVECESIYPKKIWIRDLPDLRLEFDLAVEAELNFCEYTHRMEEEEPAKQWFLIKGEIDFADLRNGFIIYSISEYEAKYQAVSDFTDYLSPCIYDKDTEDKAEEFLNNFYPEALAQPCSVDVNKVLSGMHLTAKERYLSPDLTIFGQIIFENCKTETYQTGTSPDMEDFTAGTILVDPRVFFLRNFGSLRHTVIHECIHWYLHKKTFLLAKVLKQAESGIKCRITGEMSSHEQLNDAWFLEWQANKIASKVLVPKKTLVVKANEFLSEERIVNPDTHDVYLMTRVVERISEFFNVSKQLAKIRLSECGFHLVDGAFDYCDGRYLKPYAYKKDSLSEKESYSVGCQDLIIESMKSPELRSLLQDKKLVYSDSHVVVNHPKYINYQGKNSELSEYGRLHLDECAIKFSIDTHSFSTGNGFYRECILCRGLNGNVKVICTFSADNNKDNIGKAKAIFQQQRDENKLIECINQFSFVDSLKNLMSVQNMTVEAVAEASGLSDRQITRLRSGETEKPELRTVVALAIALNLPYDVSIAFLKSAGQQLMLGRNEEALYRHFLLDACCMSVHDCNEMLVANGYKSLN